MISLRWLQEFADLPDDGEAVAQALCGLVGALLAARAHDDLVACRGEGDGETATEVAGAAEDRDLHVMIPLVGSSPMRRSADWRVLANRKAIVMGPTPPGTGVRAPATSATSS